MRVTSLEIFPFWSIALAAAALLVALAYGSVILRRKQVPAKWVGYLAALRTVAVLLFVLCLIRPVITRTDATERGPELIVLVDTSGSMALPAGADGSTRLDAVKHALTNNGFAAATEDRFRPHWFAFDRDAHVIERDDLGQIEANGDRTQLAESLHTAWRVSRQLGSGRGASRAVLVTDGNDAFADDVVATARQLGLTVYAMAPPGVGQPAEPTVTIAHVQSQRRVLIGSEIRFLTTVRQQHAANVPLIVELFEDDELVSSVDLTLAEDDVEQSVRFTHKPLSVGDRVYTFRVRAKADGVSLAGAADHRTSVQVLDHRHEVLLLEDSWRWEMKYLKRVLEDDPSFALTGFVMREPGTFMQFTEPDSAVKSLAGFPRSRAELAWFDVIVLGDVVPQRWPPALVSAIHDVVAEEGKSLIILAGPSVAHLASMRQLDALLPVEVTPATSRPLAGPVMVQPSIQAADSAFFRVPAEAQSAIAFSDLPPMDYLYPPLRKRPAATILLETTERRNAYGNIIVMAEHTVGRGRVLFVGTDTLWKWQMLPAQDESGQSPYKLFWQQTLRAMAPDRSRVGSVNVYLGADRTRYAAGQPVSIHADILADTTIAADALHATVTLPDQRELPIGLAPDTTDANRYHASFEVASPGPHHIAASVVVSGRTIAETSLTIDVEPTRDESDDHEVNIRLLEHLTSSTGGHMIDPLNPDTFPTRLSDETITVQQARTFDLWHQFYLIGALVVVLGVDWLIRLLRGFV